MRQLLWAAVETLLFIGLMSVFLTGYVFGLFERAMHYVWTKVSKD